MMYPRLLRASLLALVALLVARVQAHTIDLDAGAKECFFEDLHTEDKVSTRSWIRFACVTRQHC